MRHTRQQKQDPMLSAKINFCGRQIVELCKDSRGEFNFIKEVNDLFKDLFGVKKFGKSIVEVRSMNEAYQLMNQIGINRLMKAISSRRYLSLLNELVYVNYQINDMIDKGNKLTEKGKDPGKEFMKRYKRINEMYYDTIKELRKVFGVKGKNRDDYSGLDTMRDFLDSRRNGIFSGDDDYFDEYSDDSDDLFEEYLYRIRADKKGGKTKKKNRKREDEYVQINEDGTESSDFYDYDDYVNGTSRNEVDDEDGQEDDEFSRYINSVEKRFTSLAKSIERLEKVIEKGNKKDDSQMLEKLLEALAVNKAPSVITPPTQNVSAKTPVVNSGNNYDQVIDLLVKSQQQTNKQLTLLSNAVNEIIDNITGDEDDSDTDDDDELSGVGNFANALDQLRNQEQEEKTEKKSDSPTAEYVVYDDSPKPMKVVKMAPETMETDEGLTPDQVHVSDIYQPDPSLVPKDNVGKDINELNT